MVDREQLMAEVKRVPALPAALRSFAACGACGILFGVFHSLIELGVIDVDGKGGRARAQELVAMLDEQGEGMTA